MTSQSFSATAADFSGHKDQAMASYRQAYRTGVLDPAITRSGILPLTQSMVDGQATKFLLETEDGLELESVVLPIQSRSGRERCTLCVSSQIGCAMGCTFCETAQMGRLRNCLPEEIIAQWYAATHFVGATITNIVFMGMGEPMDNFENVEAAIAILTDQNGPCIAPSRITVSTVGHIKGMTRYTAMAQTPGMGRLGLAVSLNAPNDTIRSQIMPLNKANNMTALHAAMLHWLGEKRRLLIEYVVIPTVNDQAAHAEEVAHYLSDLPRTTINVIPYNPRRNSPWPACSDQAVSQFATWLSEQGSKVMVRRHRGRQLMAACGQLGNTPATATAPLDHPFLDPALGSDQSHDQSDPSPPDRYQIHTG